MFDCELHDKPAWSAELDLKTTPESAKMTTELPLMASGAVTLTEMFERTSVSADPKTEIGCVVDRPVMKKEELMTVDCSEPLQLISTPFKTATRPAPMSQSSTMNPDHKF
jgi:hypothetical protein